VAGFRTQVKALAGAIAHSDDVDDRLRHKRAVRHRDECVRPLSSYRFVELTQMQRDFSALGFARARQAFVHKSPLQPFTHVAAVASIIRSADARAPQASHQAA
jgi:hypothetical protein